MYDIPVGRTVLIGHNCHKLLAHLLMINDVVPIYLTPSCNAHGIFRGILQWQFSRANIAQKVAAIPQASWPVQTVITNSTYDGLLYKMQYIKQTLAVPSIHFDSVWAPYTTVNPICRGKNDIS